MRRREGDGERTIRGLILVCACQSSLQGVRVSQFLAVIGDVMPLDAGSESNGGLSIDCDSLA
jgi:hypothetical protein